MPPTCFIRICLLVLIALHFSDANAVESAKDFAKCKKTLVKYANTHLEQGAKARRKYEEKIQSLIARYAKKQPDPSQAKIRMAKIVARITERHRLDELQDKTVKEFAENAINTENNEKFRCKDNWLMAVEFKLPRLQFEEALDVVETEVRDRLDIENLSPDEGLVLISFYSNSSPVNVTINRLGAIGGSIEFDLSWGREYFRVVKAKAGDYEWHAIKEAWWKVIVKRADLGFTVEAGKLNYTGLFVFPGSWNRTRHIDVYDRTAVTLTLLEQRYPELLEDYELANGLYPEDRFIEFYMSEKASAELGDDGA